MQQRVLLAVLALLALSSVQARLLEDASPNRQLQQIINTGNQRCPDGCLRPFSTGNPTATDYCQQDATAGGLYCTRCAGSLVVKLTNGRCSCPRGKYSLADQTDCIDCEKSYYCAGGDYEAGKNSSKVLCPDGMTTVGKRTETARGCVNTPGYSYSINATGHPTQTECPLNTYSPGFKKQRACVPCPTGFITLLPRQRRPDSCFLPAGYYLKAPGQGAPCPMGEWKADSGITGNCTKCAFGVTTLAEASIAEENCTQVIPGRFATLIDNGIVKETQVCPQKFYCPGGTPYAAYTTLAEFDALNATLESTIVRCEQGKWTQDLGSTDADQCLTPPGFQTFNGNTTQCEPGFYRADWKPSNQATNCLSCGTGVFAEQTDRIKVYDLLNPSNETYLAITSSSDDCYIKAGQGLYYSTITGSWRARNCDNNNYGVPNTTYGLTPAPCKDCPAGMVTNTTAGTNSSAFYIVDGSTGGFYDVLACVTQNGWGYNGRIAQKCDQGTYNIADNRATCTACDYGFTTADVGAGVTEDDCGIAAGFGWYNQTGPANASVPCPIGTFNNITWNLVRGECVTCPTGLTTVREGSNSADDCNMCKAGYGGPSCGQTCGGNGTESTYGPPGRGIDNSACLNCSFATTGFSFEVNSTNVLYQPRAVSRPEANFSGDCLTEFTQVVDKAWYMPIDDGVDPTTITNTSGLTFQECMDACDAACAFINYNYDTSNCQIIRPDQNDPAHHVAWKVGPSGDIATSAFAKAVAKQAGKNDGKVIASGYYTWWLDANAMHYGYGGQVLASTRNTTAPLTTIQDCLNICDDDSTCAGLYFAEQTGDIPGTASNCKLIFGNPELGRFIRGMLRTDVNRLTNTEVDGVVW